MRDAGREEEGEVDGGRWAEATEGQGGVKMALDNFDLKSGQIALMESLTKLVWFQLCLQQQVSRIYGFMLGPVTRLKTKL